jgi:pyruvate-ferredoxin/flavodoxin oxidoreductase
MRARRLKKIAHNTPLGASAKFAVAGKRTPRKDLALQDIAYGHVYVAQVALGSSPEQTIRVLRDTEAYEALILAYSHCIAHGYDLRDGVKQQQRAVGSGFPRLRESDMNPFRLDSTRPRLPVAANCAIGSLPRCGPMRHAC